MWGTEATACLTSGEGDATVFVRGATTTAANTSGTTSRTS